MLFLVNTLQSQRLAVDLLPNALVKVDSESDIPIEEFPSDLCSSSEALNLDGDQINFN